MLLNIIINYPSECVTGTGNWSDVSLSNIGPLNVELDELTRGREMEWNFRLGSEQYLEYLANETKNELLMRS